MGFKLTLILVDSALEPIPPELRSNPRIIRLARRLGRDPNYMPLDKALHYRLMRGLRDFERRGRPDIVHKFLLDSLNSVLALKGMLKVYIHTIGGLVIDVAEGERPPQNYLNFLGLMEQLFKHGRVPPEGRWLMRILNIDLRGLLKSLNQSPIILLERGGVEVKVKQIAELLVSKGGGVVLIGGVARGLVGGEVRDLLDGVYTLAGGYRLTTSHVTNALIVSIEESLNMI